MSQKTKSRSVPLPKAGGHWVTESLPESDTTVLMRLAGGEYLFWPGFHDGEQWLSADSTAVEGPVMGWMDLEDALALLDGKARL